MALNRRFGSVNQVPIPLQLLTNNSSAYTNQKTSHLLKALGIEDCKTVVGSPQSNGMAESFVKSYLPFIDLESAETALNSLPSVIKLYNEEHPHSALGYLSPMEYRKARGLNEPEPRQEEPICLIPGFMVNRKVEGLEERGVNVCKLGGLS